jgi:putative phosphoribosyl transferase
MRMFADRADGGLELARLLRPYKGTGCVVYALPRGGVITAKVVADELNAPLDLIITRKIGHPNNPEYALGAITDDGDVALDSRELPGIPPEWLTAEKARQLKEAQRRRDIYLAGRTPVPVKGKTAILVDDGIATGYTMEAAIFSVRKRDPSKIVVAAPVAPEGVLQRFKDLADEVVVVQAPELLYAIGYWYDDFAPVEDDEVLGLMNEAVSK